MSRPIEVETVFEFSREIDTLRQIFPALAEQLDRCLFDVMNKYTPKCGHGTCPCQTMTFAKFHNERNSRFARAEARAINKL